MWDTRSYAQPEGFRNFNIQNPITASWWQVHGYKCTKDKDVTEPKVICFAAHLWHLWLF